MTSSPPAASRGPPASIEDQSGPTAGPYHYDPKTGAIYASPPDGGSASIAQALPNARRHANGRLLAATHDLLAFAKAWVEHAGPNPQFGGNLAHLDQMARAALAKAGGA